jgi:hypothetical protein
MLVGGVGEAWLCRCGRTGPADRPGRAGGRWCGVALGGRSSFRPRAVATAFADREEARLLSGWVFFDRGLVDASVALEHLTGEPTLGRIGRTHRYHRRVFLAPP